MYGPRFHIQTHPITRRLLTRTLLALTVGLVAGGLGWLQRDSRPAGGKVHMSESVAPPSPIPEVSDLLRWAGQLHLTTSQQRALDQIQRQEASGEKRWLDALRTDASVLQRAASGAASLRASAAEEGYHRYQQDSLALRLSRDQYAQKALACLTPPQRSAARALHQAVSRTHLDRGSSRSSGPHS